MRMDLSLGVFQEILIVRYRFQEISKTISGNGSDDQLEHTNRVTDSINNFSSKFILLVWLSHKSQVQTKLPISWQALTFTVAG